MSSDIVTRLRGVLNAFTVEEQQDIIDDAADEIKRLRAAGDALAATWPEADRCNCDNADCRAVVAAYTAWQEARRAR